MSLRLLFLFALCAAGGFAQGSGVIFGNATDSSGAAVPNVSITVTNENTQISTTVKSNEQGYYIVPDLRAGNYQVSAEASGFSVTRENGILLQVDQRAHVDLVMKV